MEQVLLVLQVLVTLALIVVVLIQRSDSDGFGLSGGSGNNLLSGRASANAMTRLTAILATIFMANALLLGILASSSQTSGIVEAIEVQQQTDEKTAPAVPAADAESPAAKSSDTKPAVPAKKQSAPAVPAADAGEASDAFDPNAQTE
jgi:preprotein translocase subunit SecG